MTGKIKNAIVATLQAINSSTVHERIDAEQKRLEAEALREKQLEADRLPLLESGDDAALDKVEAAINESRTAQLRTQERIELLTKRLSEREQLEQQGKFDELRERADRLREVGEQLIREQYAKAAGELATRPGAHPAGVGPADACLGRPARDGAARRVIRPGPHEDRNGSEIDLPSDSATVSSWPESSPSADRLPSPPGSSARRVDAGSRPGPESALRCAARAPVRSMPAFGA